MKESINNLIMILVLVITKTVVLTDEQIQSVCQIIWGATMPTGIVSSSSILTPPKSEGETICGMTELAKFLGVSVPTACKLSKSGKFDEARLFFGTKKYVWDRAKLMDIARGK